MTIKWKTEENNVKWAIDENNNRCSVRYFGSEEGALKALSSLEDCSDCSDCRDCSDCHNCSDCNYCNYCRDCRDCSDCHDCSYCRDCSYCDNCSDCRNCRDCSDFSDCSYCTYCNYCSDCHDCSDCRDCSDCHNRDVTKGKEKQLKIPNIDNIHQKVLESDSKEGGLEMGDWHTCDTTHCRAGWVVHLAGKEGYELEKRLSTPLAALKIYRENSDLEVHLPDFYKTNEETMEDMRRLAEEEAKD